MMFISLIIYATIVNHCHAVIGLNQVQLVSNDLEKRFKELFTDATHYDELQKEFEILVTNKQMLVKHLNVAHVSEEFNTNMRKLLLSEITTVKRIKQKAEELFKNYTTDPDIKPFDYPNDKTVPKDSVRLEPTFFHDIEINLNQSFVQLPTNIYEKHKLILNEVKWSEGLDQTFLENYKATPELLWQYFGSENGIFRSFPGYRKDLDVLDLFDCRRRLWYSQAINSPKDVLILVDQSGSMTGSYFSIAQLTVKSLIDTLQQDDFFNVVTFQEDIKFLLPCEKGLTQASSKNKEEFRSAVDNLPKPTGMSNIKVALRKVFDVFKNANANSMQSSNCTRALMLISDGIEGDGSIEEEIDRLNVDQDVVIFSYFIGQGKHQTIMKNIACKTGGKDYKFLTVGNVWNGVLEYQNHLSLPISQSNNEMVIFTPLYLDSLGLGMMTTLSVGVFSNKSPAGHNTLLGVAGIDIRITLLQQQYPRNKLGVFGHAFSINNNGLFLIHPRFRDQTGYLTDPATVYLDELEYTTNRSKSKELQVAMIDGIIGCMDAELNWFYFEPSNRRVVRFNTTYCYSPIEGTPFSSGVSVPYANKYYMEASPPSSNAALIQSIEALNSNSDTVVEIANWLFCNISAKAQKTEPASLKLYPTALELQTYLNSYYSFESNDEVLDNCNNEILLPLLLSAKTISKFKNSFFVNTLELKRIRTVYIISASGYILTYPKNLNTSINRDILIEKRYSHPAAFHLQGMSNILVFTTSIRFGRPKLTNNDREGTISVGTAITVSSDKVLTAVIGMDVSTLYLKDILEKASKSFDSDCKDPAFISHNCGDVDNLQRYLVDEHGYVVVSNGVNAADHGLFFGYVNGLLMEKLEELGIYERKEYIDNQAQCNVAGHSHSSSAGRVGTVLHYVGNILIMTFKQMFAILSVLSTMLMSYNEAQNHPKNVSCTKIIIIHTLKNHSLSYSGNMACNDDCQQTFAVQAVKNTNLVLIMVENNCAACTSFYFGNEPVKQAETGVCNDIMKYRKAYPLCHKATAEHSECSRGNRRTYSLRYTVIITMISCLVIYTA